MPASGSARRRSGLAAALVVLALYGGLAATVDFPSAAIGIQSDEATYYLAGHSLAADGDLEYRREDLVRTYREFPSGPSGIFLKRGVTPTGFRLDARPPFFRIVGHPDPNTSRLYFGKSFAYPLAAAPFVWIFGTKGFLVLNALLLTASFLLAYAFLSARAGTAAGLLLGAAFVFATVVPVYFVWIAPELFNFALTVATGFLWLYKHVAPRASGRGTAWLRAWWTDLLAAAVIGVLTFSKVTNVLLLVPFGIGLLAERAWRRALAAGVAWGAVTLLFFGANVAISGDWNYQGGERVTCYGQYPFQSTAAGIDVCDPRGRDEGLGDVIFDPEGFWTNLRANGLYVLVGRYSGLFAYFFPALAGVLACAFRPRGRPVWQWLVLAGMLGQLALFVITQPYTYFGGGGSVGNRYFVGPYGLALFVLPASGSLAAATAPWLIGGLFMGKLVLDPFHTSIRPADHAKAGLFRLLPIELTNVNDLPINTDVSRVRIWYGETDRGNPGFQIYYLDDNAYLQEADRRSFWTRGASRAELLIKSDKPYSRLQITISSGAVPTTAAVRIGGRLARVDLAANASTAVQMDLGTPFPYRRYGAPTYVWVASVSSTAGFVPALVDPASTDRRYLGVRVEPIIVR